MTEELRERVARAICVLLRAHVRPEDGPLRYTVMPAADVLFVGQREYVGAWGVLLDAQASLSVSPWLPLPPVPVPGVAPWDGEPVDLWCVREMTDIEHGYLEEYGIKPSLALRIADAFWSADRGWESAGQHGDFELISPWMPTHYVPLPSAPAVEG